jgi:hypothetical protein
LPSLPDRRYRCNAPHAPDPLAEFRRLGFDARLAWHGDDEHHALVLIEPDPENLRRLSWAGLWAGEGEALAGHG